MTHYLAEERESEREREREREREKEKERESERKREGFQARLCWLTLSKKSWQFDSTVLAAREEP